MTNRLDRRTVVAGLGAIFGAIVQPTTSSPELVLYNGKSQLLTRRSPK